MFKTMRWASVLACCGLVLGTNARAAGFPDHQVRFVVGFSPGGGTDALSRVVAQKLSEIWGQPVVVENRAGADGSIAADLIAHSPPDGYTMAWITNGHTATPNLRTLSYDPIKSFVPLTEVGSVPDILVVNPDSPFNSVKDLIAAAKAKPGQLNFASVGEASSTYVEAALLMKMYGIKMVHVPFPGGPPAVTALLGNEVQLYFAAFPSAAAAIKAGKLKALAISSAKRSPAFPDLPTMDEALGQAFAADDSDWTGTLLPAGTPKAVVDKIYKDMADGVNTPEVQGRLAQIGFVSVMSTPDAFAEKIRTDIPKWADLLKEAAQNSKQDGK